MNKLFIGLDFSLLELSSYSSRNNIHEIGPWPRNNILSVIYATLNYQLIRDWKKVMWF